MHLQAVLRFIVKIPFKKSRKQYDLRERFFKEDSAGFQVQALQHGFEGSASALNKLVESIVKRVEAEVGDLVTFTSHII